MARRNEYTGERCACGRPMYVRVVQIGSRLESRRGPSCWSSECSLHRGRQHTRRDGRPDPRSAEDKGGRCQGDENRRRFSRRRRYRAGIDDGPGPDAEDTWQRLLMGESGIRPLTKDFVEQYDSPVRIGGQLREGFDEHLGRVENRWLSYMQKMAVVLSRRLWDAAKTPDVDTTRLMVSIGLAHGSTEALVVLYDDFLNRGMRAVNPLSVQMHMPSAPAAAVGLDHGAATYRDRPVSYRGQPPAAVSSRPSGSY